MTLTPQTKTKIKDLFREISQSKDRIKAEQEMQKEAIEAAHADTGLEKAVLKRGGDLYHKQNLVQEQTKADEIFTLVEEVIR